MPLALSAAGWLATRSFVRRRPPTEKCLIIVTNVLQAREAVKRRGRLARLVRLVEICQVQLVCANTAGSDFRGEDLIGGDRRTPRRWLPAGNTINGYCPSSNSPAWRPLGRP